MPCKAVMQERTLVAHHLPCFPNIDWPPVPHAQKGRSDTLFEGAPLVIATEVGSREQQSGMRQTYTYSEDSMHCPITTTQSSLQAQHCREHLGLHPCDRRRNLSVLQAEFPGVDFSLVRRGGYVRVDLFQQLVLLCELLVLWCRFGTVAGTTSTEPCRPSHHQIESEEDGLWDAHSRETEQELLDRGGKLVEVCAR